MKIKGPNNISILFHIIIKTTTTSFLGKKCCILKRSHCYALSIMITVFLFLSLSLSALSAQCDRYCWCVRLIETHSTFGYSILIRLLCKKIKRRKKFYTFLLSLQHTHHHCITQQECNRFGVILFSAIVRNEKCTNSSGQEQKIAHVVELFFFFISNFTIRIINFFLCLFRQVFVRGQERMRKQ